MKRSRITRRPLKRLLLIVACCAVAVVLALVAAHASRLIRPEQALSEATKESMGIATVVDRSTADEGEAEGDSPGSAGKTSGQSDEDRPANPSSEQTVFVMPEGAQYDPDVALITVADGSTVEEVNELLARSDSVVTREVTAEEVASGVIVVEISQGSTVEEAVNELAADPVVSVAQPDYIYYPMFGDEADLRELLGEGIVPESDEQMGEVIESVPELPAVEQYDEGDVDEAPLPDDSEAVDVDSEVDLEEESPESADQEEELLSEGDENAADVLEALKDPLAASINDPYSAKQWALSSIRAYEAWAVARCEGTVTVAVFDQCFEATHEDLAPNVKGTYDAHADCEELGKATTHGTHVAGIVSAVADNGLGVAGVSYNAGILLVNVFDESGGCSTSDLGRAYDYVMGLSDEYNVRVVNLSLGAKVSRESNFKDDVLVGYIRKARQDYGIVTVAAAGNVDSSGVLPYYEYPGDADCVVSVINLCQSGDGVDRYYTSNYNMPGQHAKNISAPGASIYSTRMRGSYGTMSGTSMAAPHVAGVLALEFAANPDLTADEAVQILYGTARDLGEAGWDEDYGFGEVDAYAAVRASADNDVPMVGPEGIVTTPINQAEVLLDKTRYPYTGKKCCPAVTVRMGGATLKESVDYSVSYSNNVKVGTATVTITGIGSYQGAKEVTFEIIGGEWVKSGARWWYRWADGSYPSSQLLIIDGKTYCFDESGWMVTGWVQWDGAWLFFDSSGALATGWKLVNRSWYYLEPPNGEMVTGWKLINGTWYWFKPSGAMGTGWLKSSGQWYYLDKSGAMATGWRKISGVWYWFDENGSMATGWKQLSGSWYYLYPSGAMATGWVQTSGKWYYLDQSGAMATSRWVETYYYVGSDGAMVTDTVVDGYRIISNGKWDGKPKAS